MEIFLEMISYFGINLIGECDTFPELLQAFLFALFAMYLVLSIIRALFSAMWKINQNLR